MRNILFMPVMTAIRTEGEIRDFYDRLKKRGKTSFVAIIACMRKILIQLNAIMKRYYAKKTAIPNTI